MRLVHLSDLQFGAHDALVARAVARDLTGLRADLVVVTGDVTEGARPAQFGMARELLERAGAPWLVVPGPHDRSWLHERRLPPAWRTSLGDPQPRLDGGMGADSWTAIGVDTTGAFRWHVGTVGKAQRAALATALTDAGDLRIVASHHTLGHGPVALAGALLGGMDEFAAALSDRRVDLALTGQHHRFRIDDLAEVTGSGGRWHGVIAQAATSTGRAVRGEPQGYNLIDIDKAAGTLRLERRWWTGGRWETHSVLHRRLSMDGWHPAA